MTPLHIEIAKSILATPRNFASDEFTLLAKNRGYNPSASAGAVRKLKDRGLIYKVGEKRCKHAIGKNLSVYRIVAGKEQELQELIDNSRSSPRQQNKRISTTKPVLPMQKFELVQAWLDGMTRMRLAA